jgi:hypothetical protein
MLRNATYFDPATDRELPYLPENTNAPQITIQHPDAETKGHPLVPTMHDRIHHGRVRPNGCHARFRFCTERWDESADAYARVSAFANLMNPS